MVWMSPAVVLVSERVILARRQVFVGCKVAIDRYAAFPLRLAQLESDSFNKLANHEGPVR